MNKYIVGFDIGTSSSKGVLVDGHGNVLFSYRSQHDICITHNGYQEMGIELWWEELNEFLKEIFEKNIVNPDDIEVIGFTGFVPGLCAIDKNGMAVGKAILHTDTRAEEELEWLNKKFQTTLTHGTLLPKLIWIKNNEPKMYNKIDKVMVPHGYLAYRLTGIPSIDYDTSCIIGCVFDADKLKWDDLALKELGIPSAIFPTPYPANHILGTVTPEASKETGLSTNTKVIAGSGDTYCSMMGGGAYQSQHLMLYLGTSVTIVYAADDPVNYINKPHFNDSKNASFIGKIQSFGESTTHLRNIFNIDDWNEIDDFLSEVEPGSENLFYIPHHKQQVDVSFFGLDSEYIIGMTSKHSRKHLYRALIEGLAYNIKNNIDQSNLEIKQINLFGGGALCKEVRQVICDVLGCNIHFCYSGSTVLGIAAIASIATGIVPDINNFASEWFKSSEIVKVIDDRKLFYKKSYEQYLFIKNNISNINEMLYKQYKN